MAHTQDYTDTNSPIVERFRKGDKDAFRELYELYAKAMLNISIRILNNNEEAQEAVQDSFLAVYENINSYDKRYSFGVWLKRIVINRSLNVLKKRKLVFVPIDNEDYAEDKSAEAGKIEYDVKLIRNCIQKLPDGYRTIFSLYIFEKYTHKEIAGILNISEGTSKSQYNRAKRKLIELIKQQQ